MSYQLKWIGGPGQFVAGVPADDIEVAELLEAASLVHGGCYESDDAGVLAAVAEIRAEGHEETPLDPDDIIAALLPAPPAFTDPGRTISEGDPLAPA